MSLHRSLNATILVIASSCSALATTPSHPVTGTEKAWAVFECAAKSKSASERTVGIRALGLLPDNVRARQLAEKALGDLNPDVRVAAATALGQMRAIQSIRGCRNRFPTRSLRLSWPPLTHCAT